MLSAQGFSYIFTIEMQPYIFFKDISCFWYGYISGSNFKENLVQSIIYPYGAGWSGFTLFDQACLNIMCKYS